MRIKGRRESGAEPTCQSLEPFLTALFDGEADEASAQAARAHLLNCPRCARLWLSWNQHRAALQSDTAPAPPPSLWWRIVLACRLAAPSRTALERPSHRSNDCSASDSVRDPNAPTDLPARIRAHTTQNVVPKPNPRPARPRFGPRWAFALKAPALAVPVLAAWLLLVTRPVPLSAPAEPSPRDAAPMASARTPEPAATNARAIPGETRPFFTRQAAGSINATPRAARSKGLDGSSRALRGSRLEIAPRGAGSRARFARRNDRPLAATQTRVPARPQAFALRPTMIRRAVSSRVLNRPAPFLLTDAASSSRITFGTIARGSVRRRTVRRLVLIERARRQPRRLIAFENEPRPRRRAVSRARIASTLRAPQRRARTLDVRPLRRAPLILVARPTAPVDVNRTAQTASFSDAPVASRPRLTRPRLRLALATREPELDEDAALRVSQPRATGMHASSEPGDGGEVAPVQVDALRGVVDDFRAALAQDAADNR